MWASIRKVASLLAGTVLLLLGAGLLSSLIPLRGQALGFSMTLVGALTSVYYIGYFAGTFTLPALVHRIGHIRAFAFCTALTAVLVLVQALSDQYWLWLVLRFLQGMALVGLYAVIESWLNVAPEPAHRSKVFSIYMMLNLGSLAMAQQFLRLQGPDFLLFSVVAILVCAATLPVASTRQAQPDIPEPPRLELRSLFRRVPTALVAALLAGLSMGALWGLLPLYARAIGLSPSAISNYLTAAILGGVVMQWPLGYLSDRVDRRLALGWTAGLAAALAMAILLLPVGQLWLDMVLVFAFGGAVFALYPIAVAHLVDYLPREQLLTATNSVLLIYGFGSALGPLMAGVMMNRLQPAMLFAWFAGLNVLLALYTLYRFATRHRERVSEDNFVPMLRTTPAVLDLHPETETAEPAEPAADATPSDEQP